MCLGPETTGKTQKTMEAMRIPVIYRVYSKIKVAHHPKKRSKSGKEEGTSMIFATYFQVVQPFSTT